MISAAQNGSGVSNARQEYFDFYANLTWLRDERGYLTYTNHDPVTSALIQRIDDVNTAILPAPLGWSTPAAGGLHLVTDYTNDGEGRSTQVLGPSHTIDFNGTATVIRRATWTDYHDDTHQTRIARGYATGTAPNYTYALINPVSITITDAGGKVTDIIQATRASTSGALLPTDSFPQSSYVRWTTQQFSDGYHLSSRRVYKLVPPSGTGTSGTNYDESDLGYDVMFRQNRSVTPGGTITRTVFDPRSNAVSSWIGTNDTGATDSDPTGGGAPGNNMIQVGAAQYDNGQAGGDNNRTQDSKYVDASTLRVTNFLFDWRNRQTDIQGEIDFYQKHYFDNLDRIVKTERYNTSLAGNLAARTVTNFDDLSRVYQTIRFGVDPATGIVGNSLTDNTWFDPAGNVLKSQPAGSQVFIKFSYDGLNRVLIQYKGFDLSESSYADAGSVADDTLFEQVENTWDGAGNIIEITSRLRYHNATGVGPLGSPSSGQPKARVTYSARYPDGLGRMQAGADYGTNGGNALARLATIPARADSILVTSMVFDSAGNTQTITDSAGTITCFSYDAAGRETQRMLNCITASSSSSSSSSSGGCLPSTDTNITVQTGYNGDGNVTTITVINSATGTQVTTNVYGTALADSGIACSWLKRYVVYADSAGGSDQVAFTYNRQQEQITLTDQVGTVHSCNWDLLGRKTQDRITTLGQTVDNAVRRIETSYEVRGMVQNVTSYDNATVGQGNIVNQVQLAYNNFAQLMTDYQSHSGAVNMATTPNCQYGFANGTGNTIRPTTVTYPNGRVLNYNYGSPGSNEDAASRIASYIDNGGSTHLADYSYLGLDKVVEVASSQASLKYTLVGTAGGIDPNTGDIYRGYDRFTRIKDLIWYNTATAHNLDEIQHGYDRAGNRLYRADPVDAQDQHDELYYYDGLYRIHDLTRGSLSAGKNSIINPAFSQCWSLDETGNWSNFRQASTGGAWDLIQNRMSNPANEITLVTNVVGSAWITPVYSAAGNMTTMPQPSAPGSSYTGTYDAWNRLVKVAAGANTVATYQYDGLKRRIVKNRYTGGVLSETRHLYYSASWQILEERVGASANANRQFVWGVHYVDDLILRDRDTTGGGTLNERFYAMQDPNWNVTGLVDTTGSVQERYSLSAYGMPNFLTPTFAPRAGSSFDWDTLFGGYRWDSETGFYGVRNRMFDPHLGVWLERDPAGLMAGVNLYEYATSNPGRFTDPDGLFALVIAGCAGAFVASAISNFVSWLVGAKTACEAAADTFCDTIGGCLFGFLLGLNPLWARCLSGVVAAAVNNLCKTALHALCGDCPIVDLRCLVLSFLFQGLSGFIGCVSTLPPAGAAVANPIEERIGAAVSSFLGVHGSNLTCLPLMARAARARLVQ